MSQWRARPLPTAPPPPTRPKMRNHKSQHVPLAICVNDWLVGLYCLLFTTSSSASNKPGSRGFGSRQKKKVLSTKAGIKQPLLQSRRLFPEHPSYIPSGFSLCPTVRTEPADWTDYCAWLLNTNKHVAALTLWLIPRLVAAICSNSRPRVIWTTAIVSCAAFGRQVVHLLLFSERLCCFLLCNMAVLRSRS